MARTVEAGDSTPRKKGNGRARRSVTITFDSSDEAKWVLNTLFSGAHAADTVANKTPGSQSAAAKLKQAGAQASRIRKELQEEGR